VSFTLDRYGHLYPEADRTLHDRLDRIHVAAHASVRIRLAAPGRPIGPWSRRTQAPEASATGRDANPEPEPGSGPCLVHNPSEPSGS
jgi:hypothetical protein